MLKSIVSAPAVEFALAMATRSDPAPAFFTFVTVNVAGARRSSSPSTRGRKMGRDTVHSPMVLNVIREKSTVARGQRPILIGSGFFLTFVTARKIPPTG